MNDKDLKPVISRGELVKRGFSAVACLAGGAFLLLMTVGARSRVIGLVLPAAALLLGIAALLSKDREDKKPGLVLSGAGALGLLIRFGVPVIKPFAGFILGLGAFGLFAAGIWKGVMFFVGLKTRT